MQPVLQLIKKHPVALGAYVVYLWFLIAQLRVSLRFRGAGEHMNTGDRVALGEGTMYGWLLLILIIIVFTLTAIVNATVNKPERWFYICLIAAILLSATFIFLAFC